MSPRRREYLVLVAVPVNGVSTRSAIAKRIVAERTAHDLLRNGHRSVHLLSTDGVVDRPVASWTCSALRVVRAARREVRDA